MYIVDIQSMNKVVYYIQYDFGFLMHKVVKNLILILLFFFKYEF